MSDSTSTIIENPIPVVLQMLDRVVENLTELSMLKRWRKEYEYNRGKQLKQQARRDAILKVVSDGGNTFSDIVGETGIPGPSVRRVVAELVAAKKLRCGKVKNVNKRIEMRFELC